MGKKYYAYTKNLGVFRSNNSMNIQSVSEFSLREKIVKYIKYNSINM